MEQFSASDKISFGSQPTSEDLKELAAKGVAARQAKAAKNDPHLPPKK